MKRKLGEICRIISGSTPKTGIPEYWDGNLKWITPAELDDESRAISDTKRTITELGAIKTGLTPLPAGTVLLSSRAPIGKVAITGCEMYCNQGFKNLICSDSINNKYLYWFLKGKTQYLNSLGRGATFKEISKKIVADIEINLPDIEEQEKIVNRIEKIDSRLFMLRTEISRLDELIKARFVEMFKGKYDLFKVGEKLKTTSGGTPKSSVGEYYDGGDIPWLTSGEVNYGDITKPSSYITEKGLKNSSAKWVPENSIVIAMYGATAGKVGIVRYKTTTNQAVCSVLPNNNFNQEFLRYAFQDISEELTSKAIGGGQLNISQTIIKNSYIVDAPIEEQERFASFAKQVDKSKFAVQKSLEKTQLLFDSLMQEYFG